MENNKKIIKQADKKLKLLDGNEIPYNEIELHLKGLKSKELLSKYTFLKYHFLFGTYTDDMLIYSKLIKKEINSRGANPIKKLKKIDNLFKK